MIAQCIISVNDAAFMKNRALFRLFYLSSQDEDFSVDVVYFIDIIEKNIGYLKISIHIAYLNDEKINSNVSFLDC